MNVDDDDEYEIWIKMEKFKEREQCDNVEWVDEWSDFCETSFTRTTNALFVSSISFSISMLFMTYVCGY